MNTTTEVKQIISPLRADERSASMLATGATLTMPTDAQAVCLRLAHRNGGIIHRGVLCNLRQLKGMARRGWLTLDHPIRPTYGELTEAGLKALQRAL